ncbi:MAG: DMT family transporter, partial [Rhodospirillales bacterium]|nr:DMT family transporter [Rhodospirillales bacterium]
LIVPFFWVTPDAVALGLFFAIGAISALGHLMIIYAFEHAPASTLAPFGYMEIATAAVVGFALFGDLPDAMTWAGIGVISASGIYIAWRERIRKV